MTYEIIITVLDERIANLNAKNIETKLGYHCETREVKELTSTTNTKFSDFRNKFFEKLETKTGWGKEQIKTIFNDTYFEMSNETIN